MWAERPGPAGAVPPEQTVHEEYVVCLEDGKRFKTLKGHLRAAHDLSPEQYRAKWALSADHPIVAPAYSARRSTMAKQTRFGKVGRDTSGSRSRQVRTAA
jgi:predicted transcriptional regulator